MSSAFVLTTLVIVATPGTGVLYTMAAGLGRGRRASIVAACGCTLGVVPHMAAAITGLAALLYASGVAFAALKYLGVAYLVFLAISTVRDRTALSVEETAPRSDLGVITSGVLLNLLNPKLTLFFFAFLPQFVDEGGHRTQQMLQLSAIFMAATFVVFALYGLFSAAVRDHVIARPSVVAWVRRTFGLTFLALAGKLALTER